ncbi:unnamed protein product [Boreogadus saida]
MVKLQGLGLIEEVMRRSLVLRAPPTRHIFTKIHPHLQAPHVCTPMAPVHIAQRGPDGSHDKQLLGSGDA